MDTNLIKPLEWPDDGFDLFAEVERLRVMIWIAVLFDTRRELPDGSSGVITAGFLKRKE